MPPTGHFRGQGTLGAVGQPGEEVTVALFDGELNNGGDAHFFPLIFIFSVAAILLSLAVRPSPP